MPMVSSRENLPRSSSMPPRTSSGVISRPGSSWPRLGLRRAGRWWTVPGSSPGSSWWIPGASCVWHILTNTVRTFPIPLVLIAAIREPELERLE